MIDDILYSLLYVLFFFLTGIILIVVGFIKHRREEKFEKCGIKTRGVIHDLVGDVEAGYYAVIHFTTRDGERIYEKYSEKTFYGELNQSVDVIYIPENPSDFIVIDTVFLKVFGKQYIVFGFIMMFVAFIMFIWYSF